MAASNAQKAAEHDACIFAKVPDYKVCARTPISFQPRPISSCCRIQVPNRSFLGSNDLPYSSSSTHCHFPTIFVQGSIKTSKTPRSLQRQLFQEQKSLCLLEWRVEALEVNLLGLIKINRRSNLSIEVLLRTS